MTKRKERSWKNATERDEILAVVGYHGSVIFSGRYSIKTSE
jgi:hypothetical protein